MVPESKLEKTQHGVAPTGESWYVLNMRDAEWRHASAPYGSDGSRATDSLMARSVAASYRCLRTRWTARNAPPSSGGSVAA